MMREDAVWLTPADKMKNQRVLTHPERTPSVGESTVAGAHKALGMDRSITRRDFLNASLLASGGALLNHIAPADMLRAKAARKAENVADDDWTGYGGVGDYSRSNGNTYAILDAGHQIRDGAFETLPANVIDTGETYDCVIVGGGISGLAAASSFSARPDRARPASCSTIIPSSVVKPSATSSSSMDIA
jgi:hypothetical protein